jgi:hypothetical protein
MKDLAYKQGMDKAAQEFGYETWADFEKDAAPLLSLPGQVARSFAGRGALIGAGVGAAGGALSGPSDQSMMQRAKRGLVGAGVGAAGGAAVGGAGGYLGQKAYQGHVQQFAGALKNRGVSPGAVGQLTREQFANAPHFLSGPMAKARAAVGSAVAPAQQAVSNGMQRARQAAGNAGQSVRQGLWGALPGAHK